MTKANRISAVVLITMMLMLAGCSSNNTGKIEGTKWASKPQMLDGQQLPEGVMGLSFANDGKMTLTLGFDVFSGTYSLGMANYVTFKLDKELEGSKTHVQTIKIDGDSLDLIDGDGATLGFNKVN